MSARELMLIDLSSIVYPLWHTSQSDPDADKTSQLAVGRVHALASGRSHVAVCCDSGKSFRNELSAAYKANRPQKDAGLQHQMRVTCEQLGRDGFPLWAVKNYEADDLVASATKRALDLPGLEVLIVSADKDLLQLVGPRVRQMKPDTGDVLGVAEVVTKFGVTPDRMRDFLTLVGDKADNVQGANGIGAIKAAALIKGCSSLDQLLADLEEVGPAALGMQPSTARSLREFKPLLATTRALITLRDDVPLPFEDVFKERVPEAVAEFIEEHGEQMDVTTESTAPIEPAAVTTSGEARGLPSEPNGGASATSTASPTVQTAIAVRDAEMSSPAPAEWERQLDPRSMRDAQVFAERMYQSRMFTAYGTPQAVLSTVMLGRELGLPAMGSLRTIHIIEGKHSLSASLMGALVIKSGLAEYFEIVEFDETKATFETKRVGSRNPVRLTHTIEMARQAWSKGDDAWLKSGWGRNPTDMLVARAQARLARMVYPDLLAGLYTPEELADIKEAA